MSRLLAYGATKDGIYKENSLWHKAILYNKEQTQETGSLLLEGTLFCLGGRSAGKSTFIDRFLGKPVEEPKGTESSQYTYARIPLEGTLGRSRVGHIWEVSGPDVLMKRFVAAPHLFLNERQVQRAVVVLTVDLSNPVTAVSTAMEWLQLMGQRLGSLATSSPEAAMLLQQQQIAHTTVFGASHADVKTVSLWGVPLFLVGTRYDQLAVTCSPEAQEALGCALRALVHLHGATLVYLGDLTNTAAIEAGARKKKGAALAPSSHLSKVCGLVRGHLFNGWEPERERKRSEPQTDCQQPLFVPLGSDSLAAIGCAPGAPASTDPEAILQGWKKAVEASAPKVGPSKPAERPVDAINWQLYEEADVDHAREQVLKHFQAQRVK